MYIIKIICDNCNYKYCEQLNKYTFTPIRKKVIFKIKLFMQNPGIYNFLINTLNNLQINNQSENKIINKNNKNINIIINNYIEIINLIEKKNCNQISINLLEIMDLILIEEQYEKFDWQKYLNHYEDLKNILISKEDAWNHWCNYGKRENRIFFNKSNIINNNLTNLIDIKKAKIGIIYAYYERKNEHKNQTNLSFFIKYGLNSENWTYLDITYLFVINNFQCEVNIPINELSNIYILKQENCSDYEAWFNGIKYFENLYKKNIWDIFDYLCFINCSITGPFFDENKNSHWLMPFYEKMINEKAIVCSPCINYFDENDICGPGLRMTSPFIFLKINENIINLLTEPQISNIDENSKIKNIIKYNNTIIGHKKDKDDAIFTGEFGFSRILLKNNYKISCLYYDTLTELENLILLKKKISNDFYNIKENEKLKKTIFIKNIWRWKDKFICLPVLSDYCSHFINKKLNYENIFGLNNNINYEILNIKSKGKNIYDSKYNWNSKIEYYNIYGKYEELITFPIQSKNYNSIAIYIHNDNDNLLKNHVLIALNTLIIMKYDIILYTISEKIINIENLPFKIFFNKFKNNNFLNIIKDISIFLQNKIYNYEWFFFISDNNLFPINGINNFSNTVINMRNKYNIWNLYPYNNNIDDLCIEFNNDVLKFILNFITNYNIDIKEYNIILYLQECNFKYNYIIDIDKLFNDSDINSINILQPYIYEYNDINIFSINLKYFKKNKILLNNKNFNFIAKYL